MRNRGCCKQRASVVDRLSCHGGKLEPRRLPVCCAHLVTRLQMKSGAARAARIAAETRAPDTGIDPQPARPSIAGHPDMRNDHGALPLPTSIPAHARPADAGDRADGACQRCLRGRRGAGASGVDALAGGVRHRLSRRRCSPAPSRERAELPCFMCNRQSRIRKRLRNPGPSQCTAGVARRGRTDGCRSRPPRTPLRHRLTARKRLRRATGIGEPLCRVSTQDAACCSAWRSRWASH